MIFLPPYAVHGTHSITPESIINHNREYLQLLRHFRDDKINFDAIKNLNYLNEYIENLPKSVINVKMESV